MKTYIYILLAFSCLAICHQAAAQGSIQGNSVMCGFTGTYTVQGSAATTGFTWTVTGGTVTSGQGTNIANISFFGPGYGRLVQVSGNGISASLTVDTYMTHTPSAITGPTSVCQGGTATYSIDPMTMPWLTSLQFFVTGATIVSQSNFSITVNIPSNFTSGQVVAYGIFGPCGAGTASTLNITGTSGTLPAAAGTISGSTTASPGTSNVPYSVPAISGATSYKWVVPFGASIVSGANTNSILVNFASNFAGGNISVSGSNGSCNGAASSLTVSSGTCPSLATGAITGNATICPSSSGTYSVAAVAGASEYVWTLLNGQMQVTSTPSIPISFPANVTSGNISVYARNASCAAGPSSTKPITVTQSPTLSINDPGPICPGSSASFAANVISGTEYKWYKNNVLVTDNQPGVPVYVYAPTTALAAGTQIKLTAKISNSCFSNVQTTSNIVTITTKTPTTPYVSITPSIQLPATICVGTSLTFTASAPSGGGYTLSNFQWKLNDAPISGNNTSTFTTTSFTQGSIVTVSATASGSCLSGTNASGTTQGFPISVIPSFTPTLNPTGSRTICSTCTQLINATPTGAQYTYSWTRNGTSLGVTTSSYTATQTGSHQVIMFNGGCTLTSAPLNLTINSKPVANAGPDRTASLPYGITLNGSGTDANGSVAGYQWTQVSGPSTAVLSGAATANLTISGLVTGSYVFQLIVTDDFGESSAADQATVTAAFPPNNFNWVKETSVLVTNKKTESDLTGLTIASGQMNITYNYFDGLGRQLQNVVVQGSPLAKDVVKPSAYDQFGREQFKYLPYVSTETSGYYKSNPVGTSSYTGSLHQLYYANGTTDKVVDDAAPFSKTIFEASPLNRPLEQGAFGTAWQPDATNAYTSTDRTTKSSYNSNLASEVLLWTYTAPTTTYPLGLINASSGATPTYYGVNQLIKSKTKDEHHSEVITYTDKEGRVVLKRVQAVAGTPAVNDTNYASTYFVYDDAGNLVAVLQPEGVKTLATLYFGKTDAEKESYLKLWAFRYTYDGRKRNTIKQTPGADPVYMVYDNRDRLVLTQNGNQRKDPATGNVTKMDWTFTKYDPFNRPVATGIYTHTAVVDQAAMQSVVNTFYTGTLPSTKAWYETYIGSGGVLGYDNKSFPQVSAVSSYLTVTYYDNYSFKTLITGTTDDYTTGDLTGQEAAEVTRVSGLMTGTQVKTLGTTTFLWSVNYYDKKSRIIQTKYLNHKGNVDRITNVYDFAGRVTAAKTTFTNGTTQTIARKFDYDHIGRLVNVWHQTGSGTNFLLSKHEYNEMGQLVDKKLHSTVAAATDAKQSIDYRYNIRGWMTKINEADVAAVASGDAVADHFGMELAYNNALAGITSTATFNGNVSAIQWSKGNGSKVRKQAYTFGFDNQNRLKDANHFDYERISGVWSWNSNSNGYGENMTYDLNGNISTLARKGFKGSPMDQLSYVYAGNQLSYINDAASATLGFVNSNTGTDDYSYDFNGNLDKDKNKGLSVKGNIKYNYLNLPEEVVKGSEKVKYIFDASGLKLAQEVYNTSGVVTKTTDYIGEAVYENGVLKMINHEEGRILPDGSAWEYQYHHKDHLGNVRVTFTTKAQTAVSKTTNFEAATNSDFLNYSNHTNDIFDHTDEAGNTYTKTQILNGGPTARVGVARSIAVLPGDEVAITAYGKYFGLTANNNPNAFINSLAAAFGVSAGSTGEQLKIYNGLNSYAGTVVSGDHYEDDESAPKAFVTIIFFDKDYNLIDAAWDQITTTGAHANAGVKQPPHDVMAVTAKAPEAGYAYVFVSNEHPTFVDVYIDDVTVSHTPSPIVSVDDYFPFGLSYNSSIRENAYAQDIKFNSKELQTELDLNIFDYGARMYDPASARWWFIDPKAAKFPHESPYIFCSDNPVIYMDPDGQEKIVVIGNQGKSPNSDRKDRVKNEGYAHKEGTRHFLQAGLDKARAYKKNAGDETVTMIIYEGQYSSKELKLYKEAAKRDGINVRVMSDDADIADYVNKKKEFSWFGNNEERKNDLITDFSYMGHGNSKAMLVGYNSLAGDLGLDVLTADDFDQAAFDQKADIFLNSCGSGLGNMYQTFLGYTSGEVTGYNVTVQWGQSEEDGGYGLGKYMGFWEEYFVPEERDQARKRVEEEDRIRRQNGTRTE